MARSRVVFPVTFAPHREHPVNLALAGALLLLVSKPSINHADPNQPATDSSLKYRLCYGRVMEDDGTPGTCRQMLGQPLQTEQECERFAEEIRIETDEPIDCAEAKN